MALSARASQEFVPIKEIHDGIVVLKDGGLRAILMASSVNISLKSEDEQAAIIMQFQNFLNTLDFSVQISMQSRKYDVTSYIATLEERLKEQTEPLLKIQTQEYIQFIENFTNDVNIMTKHFFVVVPYTPTNLMASGGFLDKILPGGKVEKDKKAEFDLHRSQLEQRVALVQQGLSRVGVRTVLLTTDQEVELFYRTFNPGDAQAKVSLEKE
jgi:hypothetical protein